MSAAGRYADTIVMGSVPFRVMYITLSFSGAMSSIYCNILLSTIIAPPAVYSSLPPSPLITHDVCFLVYRVFCLALVSCRHTGSGFL